MSANCGVCNKQCVKNGSEVMCDGSCNNVFHPDCVKGDLEGRKTRSGNYKCKKCRSQAPVTSVSTSESLNLKEFISKSLADFKNEILKEVQSLRSDMNEHNASVEFLSAQVDTANSLMKEIKEELVTIRKENNELREKCVSMSEELFEVRERLRNLEQYTRKNNIEISGIPVTQNENVIEIVKDIGSALSMDVEESQITAAHRIPSFKKDRPAALIVQFQKKDLKDKFVNKYKEAKSLTADQVNTKYPKNRVYINDHLCPENKMFLGKLKSKCNELGYSYAWCRDGKFYVRKAQGENCIKILTLNDINKLK